MVAFFPHGHWRPDLSKTNVPIVLQAENVLPQPQGFRPIPGPVAASQAPADPELEPVLTAYSTTNLNGIVRSFVATTKNIFEIQNDGSWLNVSKSTDAYNPVIQWGWDFEVFGDWIVATNHEDPVQRMALTTGTQFEDVPGSPPRARFVEVVQDQLVLAYLNVLDASTIGQRGVAWSGIGNLEQWDGTNSSGQYGAPTGGPITGLVGGEVGYILQRNRNTRMEYVPGASYVYQFNEIEREQGSVNDRSIVRIGRRVYMLDDEGFKVMSLATGETQPVGINKWLEGWQSLRAAGSDIFVQGARAPNLTAILWAFVSAEAVDTAQPDKILLYDWSIDEATIVDFSVRALYEWTTRGETLDSIGDWDPATGPEYPYPPDPADYDLGKPYGGIDGDVPQPSNPSIIVPGVPVSLDSAFWLGGASIFGAIGTDNRLYHFQGPNMAATITTADAQVEGRRSLIRGVRPEIETAEVTAQISAREREADPVNFNPTPGQMETTGYCSMWESGNVFRVRFNIPEGADWKYYTGVDTDLVDQGRR